MDERLSSLIKQYRSLKHDDFTGQEQIRLVIADYLEEYGSNFLSKFIRSLDVKLLLVGDSSKVYGVRMKFEDGFYCAMRCFHTEYECSNRIKDVICRILETCGHKHTVQDEAMLSMWTRNDAGRT